MRSLLFASVLALTAAVPAYGQAPVGSAGFPLAPVTGQRAACGTDGFARLTIDGRAVAFPCRGVDLMSYLPLPSVGGACNVGSATCGTVSLATTWGWTDPETRREYALLGRSDGTSFVDVTDPLRPVYVGILPRPAFRTDAPTMPVLPSQWRELKVLGNTVAVVSEANGHGMQTFDLRELRRFGGTPITFAETGRYTGFGRAHNVLVSEVSGTAIATGLQGTQTPPGCGLGLHIVNIAAPATPTFDACYNAPSLFATRGYTHDAQCVRYRGPDTRFTGREICLLSNEKALITVDLTNRSAIRDIGATTYPNAAYTHQAWFTEDQRYAFLNDELDESRGLVPRTRTFVFDLQRLDTPILAASYDGPSTAIDHNEYIRGQYVFQANYTAGVRILDATTPTAPVEAAFFDTYPANDATAFNGIWNVYPYFPSGNIVAGGIAEGLFVLRPTAIALDGTDTETPTRGALQVDGPNPTAGRTTLRLASPLAGPAFVAVYDASGRRVAVLFDGPVAAETRTLAFDAAALAPGVYTVRASLPGGTTATARVVVLR